METATPTRILLIEDNPGDALLLQEALREKDAFPYLLERAVRLREGQDLLARGNLDLVLLDLFLPDSSGLATLKTFLEASPHVPVVVLTGLAEKEMAVQALHEGAQDFLMKDHLSGDLLKRSIRYSIERYRLLKKAQENEERYFLAAMGSRDGLWDWNFLTHQIYLSPRWKMMLGYEEGEIGGSPEDWFGLIHPEDLPKFKKEIDRHLQGETPHFANEHRLRHKDGRYRWVLSRGLAIKDKKGQPTRMAGSLTDITRHKNLEQVLALQAYYDNMTGLPNRALFMKLLSQACDRLQRLPSSLLALFYLDLDRFKYVNDSLGHPAGDRLLVEFAQRLKAAVRPYDVVGRMGGDEFTVLLEELHSPKEAVEIAERIQEAARVPYLLREGQVQTGVSIGIAFSDRAEGESEKLLKDADSALYQSKSEGGAHFVVYGKSDPSVSL